ncbi:hypothetical protein QYE76_062974 [Lolium multiflorum]|uniref:DUF4216 domain-containing protein n=1 Tax=Lolium multiflorum TaxID=4521 RepID=A0AAD8W8M2_LOLMU|nr:hypothetical protein QYE76_062974 [Lolium multiflorum]
MMEDDDEEEEDDDMYPNYGDTATGHDEDEEAGGGDQDEEASDEPVDDDLRRAIADAQRDAETENEKRKLKGMLDDHKKKLYPNCEDGNTKLGATLELLQWKAKAGICDKPFEKLLKIMKRRFPKDNELPDSTYEAKKVLLEVLKIHACINDCILYRAEYENLEKCPVCTALRYKIGRDDPGDVEDEPPRKRVPAKLYLLAGSPSSTILTFQGYEINGNTFYTFAQDKKSNNQSSGVRIDATNTNRWEKDTYYGYIEEIWELDYGPSFKIPLFRCKWFKLDGKGVKVDQLYGITTLDLNNLGYRDEPFVLANDVAQVFYVKDMSSRPKKRKHKETSSSDEPKRHIVLSGKRTIVGVEDKTDMSEDYNKFAEIPPFTVNIDPTIALNAEDTPWLRSKRS